LGCNPATIPDDVSILTQVAANAASGHVGITASHVDSGGPCASNRTFTITALDLCYQTVSHAAAVYFWTNDTVPPVFTQMPSGGALGVDPSSLPSDAQIKAQVRASDACSDPIIQVSHKDESTPPQFKRTFTVVATDNCGNQTNQTVVFTASFVTKLPPLALTTTTATTGNALVLARPSNRAGVLLQSTTNLADSNSWQIVLPQPNYIGGDFYATNDLSGSARFFRLMSQ
jgi:hypothetical protein